MNTENITGTLEVTSNEMSLRDYFAGKALQGYLSSVATDFEPVEFATRIAEDAYCIADAMLKARASNGPDKPPALAGRLERKVRPECQNRKTPI